MPRSASTSKRNVSSGRGRFQPQPMESELERTPVLFRLPEVELPPQEPDSSSMEAPPPTEEHQDEYQTPPEEFAPEHFESEFVAAPPRRSQLDLPSAEEVEASLQETSVPQTEPTTTTSSVAEEEKPGSWWEHWSSGVVLILLIIALVTASIIAFNDAQDPEPDLFAEDGQSEEFSLSEIVIPEMQTDLANAPKATVASESSPMVPPLSLPTQSESNIAQEETAEDGGLLLENLPDLNPNSPAAPAASPESQLANQPPASTPDSSGTSMSLSENLQFSEPTPALSAASADAVAMNENNSSLPGFDANSGDNSNQPGEGLSLELPPLGQQDSQLLPPLAEADNNKPQNVDLTNLKPALPEPQLPADTTAASASASASPGAFPAIPETPAPTYDSILKLPIPSDPAAAGNVQTVAGGPADAQFSTTGHRSATTAADPQLGNTSPPNNPAMSSSSTPVSSNAGLTPEGDAAARVATPHTQNNTPEIRRTATAEGNEDAIIRAWQSFRPSSNRYQ